jgi:hypothetical protein
MTLWNGEWHPLAERFPMLSEDDLRALAASISEHGQYVPCRMTVDGLGLDGRNRVAACALAEVEPKWLAYDGDAITFIVEVNADRRHLSVAQRAMAIAIGLGPDARSNGRWKRSSYSGTPNKTLRDAFTQTGVIIEHAPELADGVLAGTMPLETAYKTANGIGKQKQRVTALGGELATLVETDVITLDEAERRAVEATRVDQLTDDLVERVRDGNLTIDEAEAIAAEREQRINARASLIRSAIETLGPMVAHPISPEIAARLTSQERKTLTRLLQEA